VARRAHPFTEAPLSPRQQVEFLASKGLAFADPERARYHLEHINYHRLRPYWAPFQNASEAFVEGASFEAVLKLYKFDRKLRLLMLDGIERLEVSLRSRWSNEMALKHGPLCLGEPGLFLDGQVYRRSFDSLLHFYGQNDDEFVQHFRRKYPQADVPPIWICSEMMSLGQLSKWLANLRDRRDLHAVSSAYAIDDECLLSFLEHLTEVRNLAAHHSRLWNRVLPPFRFPRERSGTLARLSGHAQGSLYNTLLFLDYLLSIISPGHSWTRRLVHSLHRHADATIDMGFPEDWANQAPWT
jgi:abortive infection bacteriophage resistance protein